MSFRLKTKKRRRLTIGLDDEPVVASYTVDKDYVAALGLDVEDKNTTRKVLPLGWVVALNPVTGKIVPNYSSYGFGVLGVLKNDADCGSGNTTRDGVVDVYWRAVLDEAGCWDNGTYGTVLQATKDALKQRVDFVKKSKFG